LPPRLLTWMKYHQTTSASAAAGVISTNRWNINSIFDPDLTGVGHNPMGYSNMIPFYNRYRVIRCKWIVSFQPTNDRYFAIVAPVNGNVTIVNENTLIEQPRAIVKPVGYNGGMPVTIKGSIYMPHLVGVTKAEYTSDDRYQAQMTTGPAEIIVLITSVFNNSSTAIVTGVSVTLKMYVELFDANALPTA